MPKPKISVEAFDNMAWVQTLFLKYSEETSQKMLRFFIISDDYINWLQYEENVTCVAFISDAVDVATNASDELSALNESIGVERPQHQRLRQRLLH